MWGNYGPEYDVADNEYLAAISTASRDTAEDILLEEYAKQQTMRRWLFDVITCAAWSDELHESDNGKDCDCPFCNSFTSPVVRVQAAARTAKRMIEEVCRYEDIDPYDYIVDQEVEKFAEHLLTTNALVEELGIAAADYSQVLQAKRVRWAKELEDV